MIFVMGVTLFTSRVVLDKLGAEDYGIYGSVGGVVAMLGFLNGTLSTGTSRFLTFELGTNNLSKLEATFNTAFYSHVILAIIVAIVLEIGGMWFISQKLLIPPERLFAAECVFQISILTMIISIIQVPYTSVIIAHENMGIYAYIGIFEACSKLLIVYLLAISHWDKLIFYAVLIACIQLVVSIWHGAFCIKRYEEAQVTFSFDKRICEEMLTYSGWSLLANLAYVLTTQGLVVMINMFFMPVVAAAQNIAAQVNNALMQFVNNVRVAINPQVIKLYAAGDYEASRKLTLSSSIYVFDLLLLLTLPAIVIMEPLIKLWLVEVPEYTIVFTQYALIKSILDNWNSSFYTPMMASGKLKWNSYASVAITFGSFAILYMLLSMGFSLMWVQWIGIMQVILFSFVVKPYILCWKIRYTWREMINCFYQAGKISILPIISCLLTIKYLSQDGFGNMAISAFIPAFIVVISAYINLDRNTRLKLHSFILLRLKKNA